MWKTFKTKNRHCVICIKIIIYQVVFQIQETSSSCIINSRNIGEVRQPTWKDGRKVLFKIFSLNFLIFNHVLNTAIGSMDKIIDNAWSKSISNIFTSVNVASEWKSSFCWKFVNVIIKKTATNFIFIFNFKFRLFF